LTATDGGISMVNAGSPLAVRNRSARRS
ncbi:MAG: hypothetical protein QOG56_2659, partial [Solirubrobacteraceae bacterium]|nr:hypothetical protein [Solirubrobacteraceae bacterium]